MTIYGGIFGGEGAPFVGATPTDPGTSGLVPAPQAGDNILFLRGDGTWAPASGGGGGDVFGPVSSTDNAIVRFDGASGTMIQNSSVTLSDAGIMEGVVTLNRTGGNLSITTTTSGNISIDPVGSLVLQGLTYPATDGTAGQFLTTNGSGTLSFTDFPGIQQVLFVSKNGNDTTGNGSLAKPYLTIAAANAAITTNDINNRFLIYIFNGTYAETSNILLKPYVYYLGQGPGTRLTSPNNRVGADPSFGTTNGRTALMNLTFAGTTGFYFDLAPLASTSAVIDIQTCTFNGGITLLGRSLGADFLQVYNTYCFGGIQLSNCQGFFNGCFTAGTNVVVDTANNAANCTFEFYGLVANNFTVTSTTGVATVGLFGGSNVNGTLTLNGAATVVNADATALPSVSTGVVVNAGTLNKVTDAYGVKYVPATPGNWPVVPANVTAALDTLAANLGGGFSYIEQTIDASLSNGSGYIVNKASQLIFTLPATAAVGEYYEIVGKSASGWRVSQNAGQTIYLGGITTTTGNTGYAQSSAAGDCVRIVCITANTDFRIVSVQGQIELL